MSGYKYIKIPPPGRMAMEHCRVSALLHNIFARCRTGDKAARVVICYQLDDVAEELRQMSHLLPAELSPLHLLAAERTITDAEFRYVFVYRENRPAIFFYFQLYTITSRNFELEGSKTLARNLLNLFLDVKKARVLVLGNALRNGATACCYDPGLVQLSDVVDAAIAVADRLADSDSANAIILSPLPKASAADVRTLTGAGYTAPWDDCVMEMEVLPSWQCLDDYMGALTRKYKTRARKILESVSELSVVLMSAAEQEQYGEDMQRLFQQVVDKQSFTLSRSGAAYLSALNDVYGDDFEVWGYFHGEQLAGFFTGIITEDKYEIYYVGVDSDMNDKYSIYFHMLFKGLERAIELGRAKLCLGRTSLDAKASLGARPQETGYRIKWRHIPDVAIGWLSRYFAATDGRWKQRNPLKAVAEPIE